MSNLAGEIMRPTVKNVDDYIAKAPKGLRGKLRQVRAAIRSVAPSAIEGIGYHMPYYAYKADLSWADKSIVWFALQNTHIGLYLPPPMIAKHKRDLKGYKTTKSAIHIPLDKKIPVALIRKLVSVRVKIIQKQILKSGR